MYVCVMYVCMCDARVCVHVGVHACMDVRVLASIYHAGKCKLRGQGTVCMVYVINIAWNGMYMYVWYMYVDICMYCTYMWMHVCMIDICRYMHVLYIYVNACMYDTCM